MTIRFPEDMILYFDLIFLLDFAFSYIGNCHVSVFSLLALNSHVSTQIASHSRELIEHDLNTTFSYFGNYICFIIIFSLIKSTLNLIQYYKSDFGKLYLKILLYYNLVIFCGIFKHFAFAKGRFYHNYTCFR